jgi:hypothetical protein
MEVVMSYKVQFKRNAGGAWMSRGSYGSESSALLVAQRLAEDYPFVRVVDPNGHVVWSG